MNGVIDELKEAEAVRLENLQGAHGKSRRRQRRSLLVALKVKEMSLNYNFYYKSMYNNFFIN